MKKITLLTLSLIMFMSLYSNKTVTTVSDPWPPFVFDDGINDGIAVEIVREALKTQGYETKHENVPWARALAGTKEGVYDLITSIWMTEERKNDYLYSDHFMDNTIKFIKLKDDDFEFTNLSSLDGKRIGLIRGYSYESNFVNAGNYSKDEVNDFITNLNKLLVKRIDLTVEDEIVARSIISDKNPSAYDKIEFVSTPLDQKKLFVVAGLKNPRHKDLIDAFNKGLKIIIDNGTYYKILEKYGVYGYKYVQN